MVLAELGSKITNALRTMSDSTVIDESVVDDMLKEICNALMSADVQIKQAITLRKNIKKNLNFENMPAGVNKRKIVKKAVFDELCALLESGKPVSQFQRGKPNVIMFVGLQGSGKTTTITKMANYYKKKGWNVGLVCADTFRAGAYDQLRQNATRCRIPFYGSYTETDPVLIANEGVEHFKNEGQELIFVDTSGRHKQEEDLFEEMIDVANTISPMQIIFVMDGSIGQAAFDQAAAFKEAVDVGAVIITKLDGHAKGGGAISAVAATKSPIIFIGTGEGLDDLSPFNTQNFVSKLLGRGDAQIFEKIKEIIPEEQQQGEMLERIKSGQFSLRDMYDQFQNLLKMGPLNKVMEMLPGQMSNIIKQGNLKGVDTSQKLRIYMTIMDSMTEEELDNPTLLTAHKNTRESRIIRIARGSGRSIKEVNELLDQYKHFSKIMKNMKNMKLGRNGQLNSRSLSQMQGMLPPGLLKSMGGASGMQQMQNMLKNFN
eukprot:TRINITY_DN2157_c0_g1_i1.p1 TRINITY_DN2157_c0_g1~~TRINITY_DN2157_c0_g1_i1.p1  ORF type:complete len:487 (-),score=184.88 TRINITY_DN2157_c0_g1_i1:103-1563(-)